MKNLDARLKMIIAAVDFAIVHCALYFIFGLSAFSGNGPSDIPIFGFVVCCVILAGEVALCIAMRIIKCTWVLKGLFLYRLIGIVAFVIAWVVSLATTSTDSGLFAVLFDWCSVACFPIASVLSLFVHVPLFYTKAVVFVILTYMSGAMVMSIRREKAFDKKMAEKRELEEKSEKI